MALKHNIVTSSVLPIASTVITAFQVTRNWITCLVFLGLSLVVLYYVIVKFKDSRQDRISGIICIVIMLISSVIGLVHSATQKQRDERWQAVLMEDRDTNLDKLIAKADANDCPSQVRLSDHYYSVGDYVKSRKYAQMAADNGNMQAYSRLVDIDYWGKGCKPNRERAFSNMLKCQRVDLAVFNYSSIIDSLSDSERARLADTERYHERLKEIARTIGEIFITSGSTNAKKAFDKYHDELVDLYNRGFVPALEYLYMEAWLNGDSEASADYARQLYAVNRIPTGPISRFHFLNQIHPRERYKFSDYEEHIAENNYLPAALYHYESKVDRSIYANVMLFREYQLYRAQYKWFKDLNEGKVKEIQFFISVDMEALTAYNYSKDLLKMNIDAIKEREQDPGKALPEEYTTDRSYASHPSEQIPGLNTSSRAQK